MPKPLTALRNIWRAAIMLSFLLTSPLAIAAQSNVVDLEQSSVQLLAAPSDASAASEWLIGADVQLIPHWHTYTYNPGDAGIPFGIDWTLPPGLTISEAYWPPHQAFNEAGLTTYGFSEQAIFTYKATADTNYTGGSITADINYLVCEKVCIPQSATLTLTLPSSMEASPHAALLKDWHDKSKTAAQWGPAKDAVQSGPAHSAHDNSPAEPATPEPRDVKTTDSTQNTAADTSSAANIASTSLITVLAFALLGGLILNLMPCVFPVLSLKALAIAKHADSSRAHIRREGIAYTLGILTCFWVLVAILIGLQHVGQSIGWGFQFQSPGFVALMALLLGFIGLNLSGLYELPSLFGGLAGHIGREDSAKNSYFTGLLAALVATPCTAPFMASAIGYALGQPPAISLLVFTFLGLGLALPFLLLSFSPALLKWLPKPGAWMESFKHFLAFPMYLSAIWLLWVLGTQIGMEGIIATLLAGITIIFFVWMKGRCANDSWFCRLANLFIILALLALLTQALDALKPSADEPNSHISEHGAVYSPKALADLRAQNIPVFVDATASWCITCKVNYRAAISRDSVQEAFKANNVTYMVADWTNKNDEIGTYLASYGYKGVPLYVYYAPGQEGTVLPQILTPDLIIKTITPPN